MLGPEMMKDLVKVAVVDLEDAEAVLATDRAEVLFGGVLEGAVEKLPDGMEVVARFRQVRILQLDSKDRIEEVRVVSFEMFDQARRRPDGFAQNLEINGRF